MRDVNREPLNGDLKRLLFVDSRLHLPVESVEHLLTLATVADQVAHSEQPKVVADGRLWKVKLLAQAGHVPLALTQEQQNIHSRLIREEPEQSHQGFELHFLRPATLLLHR